MITIGIAALGVAHELGTQVFMDCQDVPGTLETPMLRDTLAQVDIFAPKPTKRCA